MDIFFILFFVVSVAIAFLAGFFGGRDLGRFEGETKVMKIRDDEWDKNYLESK